MSTRSTTHFVSGETAEAIIYRHSDGYPEGHGKDLAEFFAAVEAQTKDTRFNDPSYLAAKLVVWLADRFAVRYDFGGEGGKMTETRTEQLDFLGVGVCLSDPLDIEYRYFVDCGALDERGRPTVTCTTASGDPTPIPA